MPRTTNTVILPQPTLDHLPQQPIDHLPGNIQPPRPNTIWDNPLSSLDHLTGTAGHADVFVFDVGAGIANGTGGGGTVFDYIAGCEPALDVIAFVDIPNLSAFKIGTITGDVGVGDPQLPDTEILFSGAQQHTVVMDRRNGRSDEMACVVGQKALSRKRFRTVSSALR